MVSDRTVECDRYGAMWEAVGPTRPHGAQVEIVESSLPQSHSPLTIAPRLRRPLSVVHSAMRPSSRGLLLDASAGHRTCDSVMSPKDTNDADPPMNCCHPNHDMRIRPIDKIIPFPSIGIDRDSAYSDTFFCKTERANYLDVEPSESHPIRGVSNLIQSLPKLM